MNDRYLFKAKRKNWRELSKEEQWVQGNILSTIKRLNGVSWE